MKFKPPTLDQPFEVARKLYPGTKRGYQTEFDNFKKKHKDWNKVLPLLLPAIQYQIDWRRRAKSKFMPPFIPPWKNFKTWMNNRCWECEFEQLEERKVEPVPVPVKPKKVFVSLTLEEKRQIRLDYENELREGMRK